MSKIVALVILILIAVTVVQTAFPSTNEEKLLLTVEIETPYGVKSGQTVIAKIDTSLPWWVRMLGSPDSAPHTAGVAAHVELLPGRHLFIPLGITDSIPTYNGKSGVGDLMYYFRDGILKADGSLNVPYLPQFVTFKNIHDPSSVIAIDPENFEATFGPGYSLKKLTLVKTDQAIPWDSMDRFPALLASDTISLNFRSGNRK